MASNSDKPVTSSEMAKYLDLLNSLEFIDDTKSAEPRPEYQPVESTELEPYTEIHPPEPDPSDLSTARHETVENRFAAHIVHGMSKLNRP